MPNTGFNALGSCFQTQQEAGDHFVSMTYPRQENGVLYSVWAIAPNGADAAQLSIFAHNFQFNATTPIYSLVIFPRCDPLAAPASITGSGFLAGSGLGLTVFLAGLAVWLVKKTLHTADS